MEARGRALSGAVGPTVAVVMGVSGSGKTTVGIGLAARLGWEFLDADDLHPPHNVEKMAAGEPLDDADRAPWLDAVAERIDVAIATGSSTVIACSALRRRYRDVLRRPSVMFVVLDGPREVLLGRLQHRRGHFMPADLLDSQLATLERPDADERAVTVSVEPSPEQVVTAAAAAVIG